jgi:DNA-binding transcriptional regulator YiaG
VARKKTTARRPTATSAVVTHCRPRPATKKGKGPGWSAISFEDLEKWRENNNVTKSAACRIWDVSLSYYQMWKKGEYSPSIDMQKRIKKILSAEAPQDPLLTISKADIAKAKKAKKEKTSSKTSTAPLGDDPSTLEVVAALKATMGIVQHRIEHGGPIDDNNLVNLAGRIQQALLGDFDF